MNIKIYQTFYKKDQIGYLDKDFEKLDNTSNLKPHLREYYLNQICYRKAIDENLDLWGNFSPKYKQKIDISGKKILNIIKNNPENDVYFFNPNFFESLAYYNVWEHGQACHENMILILENLFPLLNINKKYLYDPMKTDSMFYCCYVVANKKFWNGYIDLFKNYFDCLKNMNSEIIKLHNSEANYALDYSLNYFPFIHERLLSSYILINNFKTFSFHKDDIRLSNKNCKNHDMLRNEAIFERNKTKLKQWIDQRIFMYGLLEKTAYYLYERCSW